MLTIIGSGLTGATLARLALDDGFKVRVFERRSHTGGNVRDEVGVHGSRYNLYGPHYFRTNSNRIWNFVNRFVEWKKFEAVLKSSVSGILYDWPIQTDYTFKRKQELGDNFETACLARMPEELYYKFVYGYTRKQWGVEPKCLSASLGKRIEVRSNGDLRLKTHRYQAVPSSYAQMIDNMLAGAEIICGATFKKPPPAYADLYPIVYTGAIDEFFDYQLGKLPYRSQQRKHTFYPNVVQVNPVVQINYPGNAPYIREIDWSHIWPNFRGTLVTREYPQDAVTSDEFEYPFPSVQAERLYKSYVALAGGYTNVLFAGRLGEYKYYDMDQAIARALVHYESWVKPKLNSLKQRAA